MKNKKNTRQERKQTKRQKEREAGWSPRGEKGPKRAADFCSCSFPASPLLCTGNGSLQSEGEEV